jgi:hypothetical protein
MSYAADHAGALRDIADAGTAVTFTKNLPGTHAPTTGTFTTPTTSTVTGSAVRVRGDAQRYTELQLVEAEAPTLLFAPDTYGDLPELESVVTWGGVDYTVRDINPVAPDGNAILARIIVAR